MVMKKRTIMIYKTPTRKLKIKQTMIYKTPTRKLKIKQNEPH
jgi:hypothetical protein